MQNTNAQDEIISYQKLRSFIGITGILLPVLTVLGCFLFGSGAYSWQHSISHYFYSKMHIVFVGTLCVLGGFLITYRGKSGLTDGSWENRISNLAGLCAFGVASFPTGFEEFRSRPGGSDHYVQLLPQTPDALWGGLHFGFAGVLFVCFVFFCLRFFQIPDGVYTDPVAIKKWNRRKTFYRICGWGIILSMIMIAIFNFIIKPTEGIGLYSTFIFETTSLWFFGSAWLVKGSVAWCDLPVVGKIVSPLR